MGERTLKEENATLRLLKRENGRERGRKGKKRKKRKKE
jgi:hypothetical protein